MSYPETIALDGDTYSSTTEGSIDFVRVGVSSNRGELVYRESATAATEPNVLSFNSSETTKAGVTTRRTVARHETSRLDAAGDLNKCLCYVVHQAPVGSGLTADEIKANLSRLAAFLAVEANQDRLINGEK
jgi:hypothetical protein